MSSKYTQLKTFSLSTITMLVLSACQLAPEQQKLTLPVPNTYVQGAEQASTEALEWQKFFNDEKLKNGIRHIVDTLFPQFGKNQVNEDYENTFESKMRVCSKKFFNCYFVHFLMYFINNTAKVNVAYDKGVSGVVLYFSLQISKYSCNVIF